MTALINLASFSNTKFENPLQRPCLIPVVVMEITRVDSAPKPPTSSVLVLSTGLFVVQVQAPAQGPGWWKRDIWHSRLCRISVEFIPLQHASDLVCRCNVRVLCVSVPAEEYNTSIQEKLPLIIGSAAAGLVFLIALVVIIIVCNRYVNDAHL